MMFQEYFCMLKTTMDFLFLFFFQLSIYIIKFAPLLLKIGVGFNIYD
jgi:hypothetical protein